MKTIISEICDALEAGTATQEICVRAAFCIENFRGLPSTAWDPDIQKVSVQKQDIIQIKASLKQYVSRATENVPEVQASAVWAFGKAATLDDREFLIGILSSEVKGDNHLIYQVLRAYENTLDFDL